MRRKKEVIKDGMQEERKEKNKEVKQVLVSKRKLGLRISEGWRAVKQEGDLTLIEREI